LLELPLLPEMPHSLGLPDPKLHGQESLA
jgi:hypothetical protein